MRNFADLNSTLHWLLSDGELITGSLSLREAQIIVACACAQFEIARNLTDRFWRDGRYKRPSSMEAAALSKLKQFRSFDLDSLDRIELISNLLDYNNYSAVREQIDTWTRFTVGSLAITELVGS